MLGVFDGRIWCIGARVVGFLRKRVVGEVLKDEGGSELVFG